MARVLVSVSLALAVGVCQLLIKATMEEQTHDDHLLESYQCAQSHQHS
jgi:hypothetical protein